MQMYSTGYPQKIVRKVAMDAKDLYCERIYYTSIYGDYVNSITSLSEEEIDFRLAITKSINPESLKASMVFMDPYTHTQTDYKNPYAVYVGCTACHPKEYEEIYMALEEAANKINIYLHTLNDTKVPIPILLKEQENRELDNEVCDALKLKRY